MATVRREFEGNETVRSEIADAEHALALSGVGINDLNLGVFARFCDGDVFSIGAESDGGDGFCLVAGEEELLSVGLGVVDDDVAADGEGEGVFVEPVEAAVGGTFYTKDVFLCEGSHFVVFFTT